MISPLIVAEKNFKDLKPISLKQIEQYFLELKYMQKKIERWLSLFYFLSPFLPLYILENFNLKIINYIAIYFFLILQKKLENLLEKNSIMIVEHGIKTKDLESLMLDGLHLKTMRLQ